MTNTLKTILIALFASIAGAYSYHQISTFKPNTTASLPVGNFSFAELGNKKNEGNQSSNMNGDFVLAAALSTPSVVFIKTSINGGGDIDLFELYFGGGSRRGGGSGSGVIFSADGYIVTNNHVIDGADKIEVIHQKKTYIAKIVGTDPSADLAIIKIEAKNLPAVKRGVAKDIQVGEWVIAVGNPFNLTSTVTAGIVSAKGRNIDLLGGQFPLESFIQTDAAINPGNSGGALINTKGELVGINTAILSRTGSYTGYGFAVPVEVVSKIFDDIIQYGNVQKAFSGLIVNDLDTEKAKEFNIKAESFDGALVTEVQADSEAEKAGIKTGDIILKINKDAIKSKSNFDEAMSYYRPADKIIFTYLRGSTTQTSQITLKNSEGTTEMLKSVVYTSEKLGADLEPISKIERNKLNIEEGGVRILRIGRGMLARLGMQEGFVITSINRISVKNPEDVEKLLDTQSGRIFISGIAKNGTKGYYEFYSQR